jgi:hypothetical protein
MPDQNYFAIRVVRRFSAGARLTTLPAFDNFPGL